MENGGEMTQAWDVKEAFHCRVREAFEHIPGRCPLDVKSRSLDDIYDYHIKAHMCEDVVHHDASSPSMTMIGLGTPVRLNARTQGTLEYVRRDLTATLPEQAVRQIEDVCAAATVEKAWRVRQELISFKKVSSL